jgi:hypothetical protein
MRIKTLVVKDFFFFWDSECPNLQKIINGNNIGNIENIDENDLGI